jgi:hypothetical protein
MDVLKSLIGVLIRIMFAAFFVAFVWWLVAMLYPSLSMLSVKATLFGEGSKDILPSPRVYGNFLTRAKTPTWEQNTVTWGGLVPYGNTPQTSGYTNSNVGYVTYTNKGVQVVDSSGNKTAKTYDEYTQEMTKNYQAQGSSSATTSVTRSLYIRNLSIYEGGSVRQGLSFVGEAKVSMFRNGSFPIVLLDKDRKVIGVSAGVALSHWSIPGWVRFETRINYQIPAQSPCIMVFQEALTEAEYTTRQPLRVPLAVRCN